MTEAVYINDLTTSPARHLVAEWDSGSSVYRVSVVCTTEAKARAVVAALMEP